MRKAIRKTMIAMAATSFALVSGMLVVNLNAPMSAAAEITPQITMVEGASIYVNSSDSTKSGIKFSYTTNVATLASGSSYGMMIVPYDYFAKINVTDPTTATDVDFIAKFTEAQTAGTISYLPIMEDGLTPVEQTDGSLACSVGFIGINDFNYDRRFVGVGYIKTVDGETTSYEYATINDGNIRDITYIASAALSDSTQTWSDAQKAILQSYVTTGIQNVATYKEETFVYAIDGATAGAVGDKLALTTSVLDGVRLYTTWTSSDSSVAKVNADGEVLLLKEGNATITATTAGGLHSATHDITVKAPTRTLTITGKPSSDLIFEEGKTLQLDYINMPAVEEVSVSWASSNEEVATVDSTGKVTQVGVGETTITATIVGTETTASITLKIIEQPTLNVKLNGVDTTVDYELRCSSDAYAGVLQEWLTATKDGNLSLNTNDSPMTRPIVRLMLPEELKAETHYEIKYTMTVNSASLSTLKFMTGKHMFYDESSGDWYRIFNNTLDVSAGQSYEVHGVFTTGMTERADGTAFEDLDLVDILYWNDSDNPNWTADILFSDIEISEVTTDDVTVSITNASSIETMTYEADKVFALGRSIIYTSSGNTLPGGRRVDFASSNEDVIVVKDSIHNGEFKIVGAGTTTLSVSLYGVEGATAEIEVTVEEPYVATPVNVTLDGETVEATPYMTSVLTTASGTVWGTRYDITEYVSANESTLSINGPTTTSDSEYHRNIKLMIALPEGTIDDSKIYTVSYKLSVIQYTIKGDWQYLAFFIGGQGTQNDLTPTALTDKEISGEALVEGNYLCLFLEGNDLILEGLQLTVSDIEITGVVPGTVMFNGESVEVTPTLTAANDYYWNTVDLSTFITATEGTLTIDGTNVVNPDSVVVDGETKYPNYRLITVYIAIPGVTFDATKTYKISYKVTTTAMTLGGSATATDFFVGNNGSKQDIVGASSKEMSGTAKIENGLLCIFYESHQMLLKDLQLTISDIVITPMGTVTFNGETVEVTPIISVNDKYGVNDNGTALTNSGVDMTWADGVIISTGDGSISIDATNLVHYNEATYTDSCYRWFNLKFTFPTGTIDSTKTYKITYNLTIESCKMSGTSTGISLYVGGKNGNTDTQEWVNGYVITNRACSSDVAVIDGDNLFILTEGNQMILEGLKMTISDIVITEVTA